MRAELAADPGLFGPVAEHPATESALVSTYRELRDLSPARPRRAGRVQRAGSRGRPPPLGDARPARAGLVRRGRPPDRGVRRGRHARPHLRSARSSSTCRSGCRSTAPGCSSTLAEHVPTTVIAGHTGLPAADAEVVASLGRLGIDASDAAGVGDPAPGRAPSAPSCSPRPTATRRCGPPCGPSSTPCGPAPGSTASPCSTPAPSPYARLAHEQLRAAGIATNGAAVVPLAARVAGRTLLELLALPAGGYRRQDVFAWLASAPILAPRSPGPHHRVGATLPRGGRGRRP